MKLFLTLFCSDGLIWMSLKKAVKVLPGYVIIMLTYQLNIVPLKAQMLCAAGALFIILPLACKTLVSATGKSGALLSNVGQITN